MILNHIIVTYRSLIYFWNIMCIILWKKKLLFILIKNKNYKQYDFKLYKVFLEYIIFYKYNGTWNVFNAIDMSGIQGGTTEIN